MNWRRHLRGERLEREARLTDFDWGFDATDVLWLRDRDGEGTRSLTNNLEPVLALLESSMGVPVAEYRVMYRDSEGYWDEVVLASWAEIGRAEIRFLRTKDYRAALALLRGRFPGGDTKLKKT
jgi:hypothetical protein